MAVQKIDQSDGRSELVGTDDFATGAGGVEAEDLGSIVSLRSRTDPSQNRKLHPPECKLQTL
jgi:hypothetical protein